MDEALNTASVASALGVEVLLAHPRGAGLSDGAIAQKTAQLGIPTVNWPSQSDPAVSLVFAGAQDRAFVSAADFASLCHCTSQPAARWIHVPGLLEARHLAEPLARARAAGARISVSGSWAREELAALKTLTRQPWDLLILNDEEAAYAVKDVDRVVLFSGADEPMDSKQAVVTLLPARGVPFITTDTTREAALPLQLPEERWARTPVLAFLSQLTCAELAHRQQETHTPQEGVQARQAADSFSDRTPEPDG